MPTSTAVDAALLARLNGDATLMALTPEKAHWDQAPVGSKRFVIVALEDSNDEPAFGGRGYEAMTYLIKAVLRSSVANTSQATAAGARIDVLLDHGTLTIPGYRLLVMRRVNRIRDHEFDAADPDIRWFHVGGRYQVMVAG